MEPKLAEKKGTLEFAPAPETESKCRHYWIIEPATGPTSMGRCKLCGAEKEFYNYIPDSWLEGFVPAPSGPFGSWGIEPDLEDDFS